MTAAVHRHLSECAQPPVVTRSDTLSRFHRLLVYLSLDSWLSADMSAYKMLKLKQSDTDLVPSSLQSDAIVHSRCGVLTGDGDHLLSNETWTEGFQCRISAFQLIVEGLVAYPRHLVGVALLALSTNGFVDRSNMTSRESGHITSRTLSNLTADQFLFRLKAYTCAYYSLFCRPRRYEGYERDFDMAYEEQRGGYPEQYGRAGPQSPRLTCEMICLLVHAIVSVLLFHT